MRVWDWEIKGEMREKVKEGWKKVKLGELAEINKHSIDNNFPYKEIEYIDISSVGTGILLETNKYYLREAPSRAKRLVNDGDTILSTVRPNRRSFLYIKYPRENFVVSTGFAVLTPGNKVDSRFLYYLVTNQGFSDYLTLHAKGAAYPAVDTETIARAEIDIPPLHIQRKIASILSVYDDLIENNTRRIKILEEMAQAIYKEWFVNFRFPGHEKVKMVDSELDETPEGWEVSEVREIVKRLNAGKTYTQKKVLLFGNIPVVDQSRDEFLGFHNNEPDHDASFLNPIIIFGDHTCKMQIMVEPFSLGPNVVPFISRDHISDVYFLYFTVRNLVETREYRRHWNELIVNKLPLPNKELQMSFADAIRPLFEQISLLKKENLNLQRVSDLLLPKLISGEICLDKVET